MYWLNAHSTVNPLAHDGEGLLVYCGRIPLFEDWIVRLVFTKDQIEGYLELKMEEVLHYEHTPHPVEFGMYYSC